MTEAGEMYGPFAQAAADYSNWGVAGALLSFAAGFIAYLKHRDSEDRKERKEMSEAFQGVFDRMSIKIESLGVVLTAAFASEMAAERTSHRSDIQQIGELVHDLRGMAAEGIASRELSTELSKKYERQARDELG